MFSKGAISHTSKHRAPHFFHVPPDDTLAGSVVHFARESARYCQPHDLLHQLRAYIHRYLELPPSYEAISALYILLSWVYEFAPSLPYLRVIGDWGTGKTRFLEVVASICFRPIFVSGAATPSPIFRILDQYRGTLVLDEADFKESSSWTDMVKILNNGYRPGFPVLRSKLLTFRLYNLFKLKGSEFTNDLLEPGLQPRLQEILMPLKALAGADQYLSDTLSTFIKSQQESLYTRRRASPEGRVILAIIQLHAEDMPLTGSAISQRVNELDDDVRMTAPRAGLMAKYLGFVKKRTPGEGRHVVVWDDVLTIRLAMQHGIPLPSFISLENPSHPSHLSRLAS